MVKKQQLTDEEKYEAVINCNQAYDFEFYYGVKTTKIFCYPSCKAKDPKSENVVYFNNIDDAMMASYRPCKLCKPDEHDYLSKPELMEKIKYVMDHQYMDQLTIKQLSKDFDIKLNQLTRAFKHTYGKTPSQYLLELRVEKAKALLRESKKPILDVAYESGFHSSSNFYEHFQKLVGMSPGKYRKEEQDEVAR